MIAIDPPLGLIANRYRLLEALGAGGMGVVYRAVDRLDGGTVALKRVTAPGEQLQFASKGDSGEFRRALAQEFRLLASLRHPNIISVLDYGFDAERQPYFTMELLEHAQTITSFGSAKSVQEQIGLLVQVLQALAYLHRRGVIHRDLKPDNTLVAGGQVKVLDFGLAVAREGLSDDARTVGTFAYMAPEVLRGGSASEAADLYAVGVMAYELFSGHHPFPTDDFSPLIEAILYAEPDIGSLNLSQPLKQVLGKLLAKSPDERYSNAEDLIAMYAQGIGQQVPHEARPVRESYLQAAKFVGRDQELSRLTGMLSTMLYGRGSAWLVGGESGVGKSRLLEELRTQALVEGAQVLRGQALADASAAFQLWREVLRRLCLQTEFTELEAGVLKALVPDISLLIGRDVQDAPEIEAQAAQIRLLAVIEGVFRKQTQPIVLLLEDIQWSDASLLVLQRLSRLSAEVPLMIVATYRNDERPHLPESLPEMQLMSLARLPESAIAELTEAMLGADGAQPQVVDLLQRETEGNVFFIVEVVRALAEDAGHLSDIGRMTLPQSVFAGGVKMVVQRRLSRVPEAALRLLKAAAVAGRELDLSVLRQVEPDANRDEWLESVGSVVEVQDNRYRFAHDKLREELLETLETQERKDLHRAVADAIAAAYPDDPIQYATLHYHWEQAGDTDKAGHFAELAGEAALKNSAASEAIRLLNRALELQPVQVDRLHLGHLHRLLGQAQMGVGQTREAELTLQQAGAELGYPLLIHAPAWRLALDIVYQFAQQVPQFVGLKPRKLTGRNQEILCEAMVISWPFDRISQMLSYGPLDLLSVRLRYAYWAAQAEPSLDQLNADAVAATLFTIVSVPPLAGFYLKRAQQTGEVVPGPLAEFYIIRVLAFDALRVGNLEEALHQGKMAMPLTRRIGDKRVEAESGVVVVSNALFAGHFDQAQEAVGEVEALATSTRDEGILAWSLIFRAFLSHWLDDYETFVRALSRLDEIAVPDDGTAVDAQRSLKALYLWREGRLAEANPVIQEVVTSYEGLNAPIFVLYHVLNELARTCAIMAEHAEYAEAMCDCLVRMTRVLRRMMRLFRIAEPSYQLYRGVAAFLSNDPQQAHRLWHKSLESARKWHMPYDEARALYEIGRHLPDSDPSRTEYLQSAAAIFERTGAKWDAKLTQALLGNGEDEDTQPVQVQN